jgi:molybdopterin biosynthesis enzyme MoaB
VRRTIKVVVSVRLGEQDCQVRRWMTLYLYDLSWTNLLWEHQLHVETNVSNTMGGRESDVGLSEGGTGAYGDKTVALLENYQTGR